MTTKIVSPNPIVDNPHTGSRDNSPHGVQLPHADLVHHAPVEPPQQYRDWPTLNTRLQWADDVGCALDLSRLERAVLNRVCWRAGKRSDGHSPGCFESTTNMGDRLGYHRNQVGTALRSLVGKGLLTATRRYSQPSIYCPTMIELSTLPICTKNVQMDARIPCTNKKVKQEDIAAVISSKYIYLLEEGILIDDDWAESCGFIGCPPTDQCCPMCGRHGTVTVGVKI